MGLQLLTQSLSPPLWTGTMRDFFIYIGKIGYLYELLVGSGSRYIFREIEEIELIDREVVLLVTIFLAKFSPILVKNLLTLLTQSCGLLRAIKSMADIFGFLECVILFNVSQSFLQLPYASPINCLSYANLSFLSNV